MRCAVLCAPESWYFRDLARAAGGDHELTPIGFDDLVAEVGLNGEPSRVAPAARPGAWDAVLVRTMPPGSLEQVVFRMDALGVWAHQGVVVVNPPRAIEAAVDKYLTTVRLDEAGLLVPPTIVCQTATSALEAFERLGRDVVVKPLFGAEGRGITRLNDEALAWRAFRMLENLGATLYLQPFLEHNGADLRVLVIGNRLLGMRRSNPHDWRTNCSRGAQAEKIDIDDDLAELARRAAQAVGAPVAGVDILPARDGRRYVLEVNAVPGWQALARCHQLDVARLVLDFVAAQVKR